MEPKEAFPASRKIKVSGTIYPEIQVPMREISLSPTKLGSIDEQNAPIYVYYTSGP
jgi:phosphomethylpyrimidine synthase